MATRQKAPGHDRYHHGDLRHALVQASLELLEAEGMAALTLREVARRLGVSHAAPKHHFADKAALEAALAAHGFAALTDAMTEAAARAGKSPLKRLTATGVAYVRFAVHHPQQFRLMFSAPLDCDGVAELREASERAFSVLREAVRAVLEEHGVHEPRRDLVVLTGAWSSVHGLATLWVDGRLDFVREQFPTVEALAEQVTRALARSLEPQRRT